MKDIEQTMAEIRAAIEENIRQFRIQRMVPEDSPVTAAQVAAADMRRPVDWSNFQPRVHPRRNGKSADGIVINTFRGSSPTHYVLDETHVIPLTVETVAAKYATAPNDGPMRDWRWEYNWDRASRRYAEREGIAGIVHQAEHYGIDYRRNQ